MKLTVFDLFFTSIDQRFRQIGFKKVEENKLYVRYEKEDTSFTHVIALCFRPNGKHWIQSYMEKDGIDMHNDFVSLTAYEAKLILKKIKEKRWVIRK